MEENTVQSVASKIVSRGGPVAALTGAGISVESGIPDFRSATGIWSRYDPEEYASIQAFLANPSKVWKFLLELDDLLQGARPNAAHHALAELERAGLLAGVATQNVDGLHQSAGSGNVIELHGNPRQLRCVHCGRTDKSEMEDVRRIIATGGTPECPACHWPLKPDVILFGEPLPEGAYGRALDMVGNAATLLVIGTSATVHPVATLPEAAASAGALIVEINLEATELTGGVSVVSLFGKAGEVLPALVRAILKG